VTTEPSGTNTFSLALVMGLVGLALGIVLAPWLERGFHRFTHSPVHQEVRS
jgi:hypothetical protein